MTDELKAIRARHEAAESDGRFPWLPDDLSWHEDYGQAAHRDRATLLRLLDAAREDVERLEAALKPFAQMAAAVDGAQEVEVQITDVDSGESITLVMGTSRFLNARAALAKDAPPTRTQGESS